MLGFGSLFTAMPLMDSTKPYATNKLIRNTSF